MDKKNLNEISRDNWTSPYSMILDMDEYNEPFDKHALLNFLVRKSDSETELTLNLSYGNDPVFTDLASSMDEIQEALLREIDSVSRNSHEQYLRYKNSMLEERATMMINMAAKEIARETRRGAGNHLLASSELFEHLSNSVSASKVDENTITLNRTIIVNRVDNFDDFFSDCMGVLMYWGAPTDGPLSIRYRRTNGGLEYDIVTVNDLMSEKEIENSITSAEKYFVRIVE